MASVIVKNPAVLSGEPVFRGTRVPFKALTDYLEGGESLGEFLEQYPSVTREAAIAALQEARGISGDRGGGARLRAGSRAWRRWRRRCSDCGSRASPCRERRGTPTSDQRCRLPSISRFRSLVLARA